MRRSAETSEHVFGDNIEDRLGHVKYPLFYLLCGFLATMTHAVMAADSRLPAIGASGAIAGVLGAYLVLFPRAQVTTLIPIFVFVTVREIPVRPAALFTGVAAIGVAEARQMGGRSLLAHIGGFVAGMLLVVIMPRASKLGGSLLWRRPGGRGGSGPVMRVTYRIH